MEQESPTSGSSSYNQPVEANHDANHDDASLSRELPPLIEEVTNAIEHGRLALEMGEAADPNIEACNAIRAVANFLLQEDGFPIWVAVALKNTTLPLEEQ